MIDPTVKAAPHRRKTAAWFLVGAGVLFIAAANAHLVYVAVTSQPDCVAHVRPGEATAARASFSAARSACTMLRTE